MQPKILADSRRALSTLDPELDPRRASHVVVLTGAGISVASGLRTYRGRDGLYAQSGGTGPFTRAQLDEDPASVWAVFGRRRRAALAGEPSQAHRAQGGAEERIRWSG